MTVVVTGAAGAIGRRVVHRLVTADPDVDVRAVDRVAVATLGDLDVKQVDLATDDLGSVFAGADTVIHLVTVVDPAVDDPRADELESAIVRRVLDAAAEVGVTRVVVLSSAMVYGAWVGNPVPLTETSPVRPNPDFGWAVLRAAVEKQVLEWGAATPTRSVAVLRATAIVADDSLGRLARVLHAARIGIAAEGDPPVQYLHADDAASAVAVAALSDLDGVANIAPDGWIPPNELSDLEGPRARVRVPSWVARGVAGVRGYVGLDPIPPGIVPYTSHSWVVSNDRIRAVGWEPEHSNEEAWVVSHDPGPLDRLPARRRQELALAAAVLALLSAVVAAVFVFRRLRRH